MCSEGVEQLLTELERSEQFFARQYLTMREPRMDPDRPGKTYSLSVDDAKANAVLACAAHKITLPEVLRYRLHSALAIERSVEPS